MGYVISVIKRKDCNSNFILDVAKRHFDSVKQISDLPGELSFKINFSSSERLPDFLDHLNRNKEEIGFSSYGLSVTVCPVLIEDKLR